MNLPNKLTLLRVILVPVFLFFYLATFMPNYAKIIALAIFVLAEITDFLDGFIARKYNMVTDFGKFLDPIADKILSVAGVLVLVVDQIIPAPFGVIFAFVMIFRDFIISGLRLLGANKGVVIMADKLGKIKTICLFISLIMGILLSYLVTLAISATVLDVLFIIFYVLIGVTALLIIISCVNYLYKNRRLITTK